MLIAEAIGNAKNGVALLRRTTPIIVKPGVDDVPHLADSRPRRRLLAAGIRRKTMLQRLLNRVATMAKFPSSLALTLDGGGAESGPAVSEDEKCENERLITGGVDPTGLFTTLGVVHPGLYISVTPEETSPSL